MVITVEMYRQVREMYLDGCSQRKIAKVLNISRNTVKKYCNGGNIPGERKRYERDAEILTSTVKNFIQSCFDTDNAEGIRKQRHTARRIYNRLAEEMKFTGGESTIRRYVHELRNKLQEAFVPLAFEAGDAIQIDWGEAKIWLGNTRITVNLFCARLCYSDAPFVIAYRRQNSESFLDAIVRSLEYFGGVSRRIIFDNAKVAVKDGFGANARVQENYAMLSAHYGFKPIFCNVASGNEKGLVEGLVGFSRRNFCVPLPRVESMAELNKQLEERCRSYLRHEVRGKSASVGTLFQEERVVLFPLPQYQYDVAKRSVSRVTRFSTVRFDTNNYSVPVNFCGKELAIKALPEKVSIFFDGKEVASHQRSFKREQNIYKLSHYLPLLEKKGRAIFQAKPVKETVPTYFLNWLAEQHFTPKELVTRLRHSLEIGFDAVMRGETPLSLMPTPEVQDAVAVQDVNLNAYDQLYSHHSKAVAV